MVLQETIVNKEFIEEMDEFRKIPEGVPLIEQCSNSVILFAERMLGIKLYSWQILFLHRIQLAMEGKYSTREFLAVTSRQIGKSTAIAILSLWACIFNKYPATIHKSTLVGIASATDVQSKKLLNEIRKLMNAGDTYMRTTYLKDGKPLFPENFFTDLIDEQQANNTTTMTFKKWLPHHGLLLKGSLSGSSIKSYPPTNSILGETFSIVIEDEAGVTENITDEFHRDYMYPTGNSTKAVRIYTSTPWMSSGFFYELADPFDEYKIHPADRLMFTYKAIELENPEYFNDLQKTIDEWNDTGKQDEVRRAYMCQFIKGARAYFNPDSIKDSFVDTEKMLDKFDRPCDLGLDFGGQVKSKTVVTISYQDDTGLIHRIYHRVYPVLKDLSLIEDITELRKVFNIQRMIVDDCPAGQFLTRVMIEQKGWDITPMNFRSEKVSKYGAFRNKLYKHKIVSYPDTDLRTEMLAFEYSESSKQAIIQHAPGYSDDLLDSFLMSTYFMIEEDNSFRFHDLDMD